MYKAKVNIHKWKQLDIISEEELLSEGVSISQWVKDNLIELIGKVQPLKQEKEEVLDLNNDGVLNEQDASIAGKVQAAWKKKSKKGKK